MLTIIADAGPLIALIDSVDPRHAWAVKVVAPLPRPWLTSSAVIAEVTHHFDNDRRTLAALRKQVNAIRVQDPEAVAVLDLMMQYAPRMDYADACAVILARAEKRSVVVTTDHNDFATYRVPFISPKGRFY